MIILRMVMMAVVIAVIVQFYFYLPITMNHTELIFIIGTSMHSSYLLF